MTIDDIRLTMRINVPIQTLNLNVILQSVNNYSHLTAVSDATTLIFWVLFTPSLQK